MCARLPACLSRRAFRRGNHGAREEDAEGNEALAEFPKACSDRHPQTADAGVHDGMGDLLVWSLRAGRKQSGRTEFMSKR